MVGEVCLEIFARHAAMGITQRGYPVASAAFPIILQRVRIPLSRVTGAFLGCRLHVCLEPTRDLLRVTSVILRTFLPGGRTPAPRPPAFGLPPYATLRRRGPAKAPGSHAAPFGCHAKALAGTDRPAARSSSNADGYAAMGPPAY